ncbi:MAG: hypothetical protein ACREBW_05975, partial [Candidatus Micrarchaeaceae archaeon]
MSLRALGGIRVHKDSSSPGFFFGFFKCSLSFGERVGVRGSDAGVTQLVESQPSKLLVAGS